MKKILLLIGLFLIWGCVSTSTKKTDTTQSTKDLISFFQKYKSLEYNAKNDILKQEIYDKREKELMLCIDSFAILTNLKGEISDIKLEEGEGGKILRYNIEISPEKYFEITFECANAIKKDSLNANYIYNKIKHFSNYSTVYFDGIISVDAEKNIPRSCNYGIELAFSYPKYKFHVVDISSSPRDTLENRLKYSILAGRKAINRIFFDYRENKKLNNDMTYKHLSEEFNKTKENLTENEKEYLQRYMNTIIMDIY